MALTKGAKAFLASSIRNGLQHDPPLSRKHIVQRLVDMGFKRSTVQHYYTLSTAGQA